MPSGMDWRTVRAPSLADFERLAAEAWEKLPSEFRNLCRDVVVRVEDFADDDVLEELGIEDAFELMGLYKGISLDRKGADTQAIEPDMVFLYRRSILDYWADSDEALGHLVAHVLIHEIGHHFGLSDEDMEQIEDDTLGS
ncbi:MAG: metallopeptidase family protein [Hyphomicrobiaceae bacterium]